MNSEEYMALKTVTVARMAADIYIANLARPDVTGGAFISDAIASALEIFDAVDDAMAEE